MKKIFATLVICLVLGIVIILGYAIILNFGGITEAFISFPLPYLFWFILGILVGGVLAPLVYNRISRFADSKKTQVDVDLE